MEDALTRRHDDYKKEHEINEMILLYQSHSKRFCAEIQDHVLNPRPQTPDA